MSTKKDLDPATRFSRALFAVHSGIVDKLFQQFLKNGRDKDLSMKQHLVMKKVYEMMEKAPDGVSLKDLANALHLTPGTVSELVEALVRKDALQRVQNPHDRRAVMITVTEYSRRTILEAQEQIRNFIEVLWQDFPEEERLDTIQKLERLVNNLEHLADE